MHARGAHKLFRKPESVEDVISKTLNVTARAHKISLLGSLFFCVFVKILPDSQVAA